MGSEMKHSFDLKRKNRRDLKRMNRTIGTVHSWANRPPDRRTSTLRRRLATDLARPARAFPFFLATKNHKSHKPDDLLNLPTGFSIRSEQGLFQSNRTGRTFCGLCAF